MDEKQRSYAALAPVLAIAGVFVHPMASAILPLIMFLIFHRSGKVDASTIALRSADLVFTGQLLIIIGSLVISLMYNVLAITATLAQQIYLSMSVLILVYLVISLFYAAVMAFRGRVISHVFSFRLAERVFTAYQARKG